LSLALSPSLPAVRIAANGIAYADMGGSGPALVFIHGVGLDHTMWAGQVAAFSPRWRVILPDMPGHGASANPASDATLDDYAAAIDGLMAELGVTRAVLVGFSMGALVARALALRHPAWLSAMVLLNGVFDRAPAVSTAIADRVAEVVRGGPAANVDAALERWFTPEYHRDRPQAIAALRVAVAGNDPAGYLTTYRLFATQDNYGADRLGEIDLPVLVATGEHDVGSTPAMAQALAARIAGAQCAILANARHMMPVEHAAETNALLAPFIEANFAPSTGA